MFLKDLKEQPQKILFLELATLIMMAEDTKAHVPKNIDSDDISYYFFQNIDKNAKEFLIGYCRELGEKDFILTYLLRNRTNHPDSPVIESAAVRTSGYEIKEYELTYILQKKADLVLKEYGKLEEFKKDVMGRIISSGEDIFNINPKMIQKFMLAAPIVKQDILKRTAHELISINKEKLGHFHSKEKKIMLFELIGAGYSSGHFGYDKKSLLLHMCELLHIENEYIEEFLEVSERLFAINKDLAILINE